MDFLGTLVSEILALFAILNPIGLLPTYSELIGDLDKPTKRKLFNLTTVSGYLTLVVMTLTGEWIMRHVFQIGMGEFKIAGGLILAVIAIKSIAFHRNDYRKANPQHLLETGVVPMAVPLLVGPGSIVTGILIYARDGILISMLAITIVFLIIWVILHLSEAIERIVGHFGILVLSRIMWIFIAAIGVHFLANGIKEVFGI